MITRQFTDTIDIEDIAAAGFNVTRSDWWDQAACRDLTGGLVGLFFSEELHDIAQAKRICATCPVLASCLEGAIERREPWGVWGGQLFANGKVLANKRRRGRPPKVRPPEPVLEELVPRYDPSFQVAESA